MTDCKQSECQNESLEEEEDISAKRDFMDFSVRAVAEQLSRLDAVGFIPELLSSWTVAPL